MGTLFWPLLYISYYIHTEKYYESVTVQGLFQVSPKGRGANGCGHDLKGGNGCGHDLKGTN